MTRAGGSVVHNDPTHRSEVLGWLDAALEAVDPDKLTHNALKSRGFGEISVIAIGKAAPAMIRGAGRAAEIVSGICVSGETNEPVDRSISAMTGDHPIPGPASFDAGRAVLRFAGRASPSLPLLALISGGGSSLCELPRPGVSNHYLAEVNRRLLAAGLPIESINLVRSHLSQIKCGGVARAAGRPVETFVISDVAGAEPEVVASGPTMATRPDPETACSILELLGIDIPESTRGAIWANPDPPPEPRMTLLADANDAAQAIARATSLDAEVRSEWLRGDMAENLERFLARATATVSIAVGEPTLAVSGPGRGGRNTHAALLAAQHLRGSHDLFVAFATDGVDGSSGSAGAMVDGQTLSRGGDPTASLESFDSASYLARTGDLIECRPTSTNVSDIWILWRRTPGSDVE